MCRGTMGGAALPVGVPVVDEPWSNGGMTETITIWPDDAKDTVRHAGVTLCNSTNGVRVIGTTKDDACWTKLPIGTIITHINGLPALHHELAVAVINAASTSGMPLYIRVKKRCTRTCVWKMLKNVRKMNRSARMYEERRAWDAGHTPA